MWTAALYGLVATAIVFGVVYLIHLALITPNRLLDEKDSKIADLERTPAKLIRLEGTIEKLISGPRNGRTMIFCLISIRNTGAKASIAEKFAFNQTGADGHPVRVEPLTLVAEMQMGFEGGWITLYPEEQLAEKAVKPIPEGGLVRGWVGFDMFAEPNADLPFTITFADVNGDISTIASPAPGTQGFYLRQLPGVKFNWRRDQSLDPREAKELGLPVEEKEKKTE
jgi:hypothetical protein